MLISEQGTHINIVDDRVEDSLSNVNLGRDQLLRAMHRYGGNRALIVKVFSVRCHPPPPAPARPPARPRRARRRACCLPRACRCSSSSSSSLAPSLREKSSSVVVSSPVFLNKCVS